MVSEKDASKIGKAVAKVCVNEMAEFWQAATGLDPKKPDEVQEFRKRWEYL